MGNRRSRIEPRKRGVLMSLTNGKCWFCGLREATTIDHIKPLSMGGTDRWGNIVPACKNCNSKKGNITLDAFRVFSAKQHAKQFRKDSNKYRIALESFRFWGERQGLDPMIPLRLLHWRGRFESIENRTWLRLLIENGIKDRRRHLKRLQRSRLLRSLISSVKTFLSLK